MSPLPSWRRRLGKLGRRATRLAGLRLVQVAALPWRRTPEGGIELLLVTGRRSEGWIVPKGWPMPGKTLAEAAAQEAWEEAGVRGPIEPRPLGRFRHAKRLPIAGKIRLQVRAYPMRVEEACEDWPERERRERRWCGLEDAAEKVRSAELAGLIRALDRHVREQGEAAASTSRAHSS